jgi:CRP-like cAMP-binding protein
VLPPFSEHSHAHPSRPGAAERRCAPATASHALGGRYLAKLESRKPFSPEARAAFEALPGHLRTYEANRDIVAEGERPHVSCFVDSGLVSRYKSLPDGGRQIVAIHIAGDMVDLQSALLIVADHAIRTHTRTNIVQFAHADLLRVAGEYPEIARAFWFDTLVDASIFREWTVNLGRRSARERTAHLLLELAWKLHAAGLMNGDSFELPISQIDLADALGFRRFTSTGPCNGCGASG